MRVKKPLSEDQLAKRQARTAAQREKREALIVACDPVCCECGKLGERVKGDRIYPHLPALHPKNFFLCECGAYVGCHPYTRIPLGRPAGPLTRAARNDAHRVFDVLWKRKMVKDGCDKKTARQAAYAWLGSQLGYAQDRCHIAWMTAPEARAVVRTCLPYIDRRAA